MFVLGFVAELLEVATVIGAFAAIVTGVGIVSRVKYINRPLKWVMKKLFVEPISESSGKWIDGRLDSRLDSFTEAVDEKMVTLAKEVDASMTKKLNERNGGSALRDQTDRIETALNDHAKEFTNFKNTEFKQLKNDFGNFSEAIQQRVDDDHDRISLLEGKVAILAH